MKRQRLWSRLGRTLIAMSFALMGCGLAVYGWALRLGSMGVAAGAIGALGCLLANSLGRRPPRGLALFFALLAAVSIVDLGFVAFGLLFNSNETVK